MEEGLGPNPSRKLVAPAAAMVAEVILAAAEVAEAMAEEEVEAMAAVHPM